MHNIHRRREHAAKGILRRSASHRTPATIFGQIPLVRPQRAGATASAGRAVIVRHGPAVHRQHSHAQV